MRRKHSRTGRKTIYNSIRILFYSLCILRIKKLNLFMILQELQQRSTEDATTTVAAMTKKNALKNGATCIPCTLTEYIEI